MLERTDLSPAGQHAWLFFDRFNQMLLDPARDVAGLALEVAGAAMMLDYQLRDDAVFMEYWGRAEAIQNAGPGEQESLDEWRLRLQMAQMQAFYSGCTHKGMFEPVPQRPTDWRPNGSD